MTVLTQDLMRQLSETPGGPGDEGSVRDLIAGAVHPFVDELRADRMGNLIALKRGTGDSRLQVVVAAHMDEVVLMITAIAKEGFLHFAASGGVNLRTLVGKAVAVGPDRLPGVVCLRPIHMANHREEFEQVPEIEKLVIDFGAEDEKDAKAKVKLGQRISFLVRFGFLGGEDALEPEEPLPERGRIKGKAFDDRLGCAALIALLSGDPFPFDLHGVFTVQEEVGLRGALVAGYNLDPDVVLVLEGTVCDDLPGPPGEKHYTTTRLGDGPALTVRDRSHIVSPGLLQYLLRTAKAEQIPYQFKHPNIGATDAAAFGRRTGIPAAVLSVPCRYIHGPVAVAELSDFHHLVALLRAALPGLEQAPGVGVRR